MRGRNQLRFHLYIEQESVEGRHFCEQLVVLTMSRIFSSHITAQVASIQSTFERVDERKI